VLVGGTAGMAAASQDALPGEVLYPVKRGIERVQADLGTSSTGKGERLLEQADNRLDEVRGLLEDADGSAHVPGTVDEFTDQAVEGSELLLESFEEDRDPAVIRELRTFTADSLPVLRELARVAPADSQDELARAAAALMEIDRRAAAACASCVPELPALRMPRMFLTAAEVERAMDAMRRTRAGNDHPALPGTPAAQRPRRTEGPAGTAPVDGTSQQPGTPDGPGLPDVPGGTGRTGGTGPRDVEDVVDEVVGGVDGATGGLLDDVDETVDELLPEELDPVTEPLRDVTDPLLP
jgi:hypothetical protein